MIHLDALHKSAYHAYAETTDAVDEPLHDEVAADSPPRWHDALSRLWSNRLAASGVVVIVLVTFISVAATWMAPYDPSTGDPTRRLAGIGRRATGWGSTIRAAICSAVSSGVASARRVESRHFVSRQRGA